MPNSTLVALVLAVAFIAAALSSIRALDALCAIIREKRPGEWAAHSNSGFNTISPTQFAHGYRWVGWLVLGGVRLDFPDDDYRRLLWIARGRLLVCLILFVIFLIGLGWFTQGTALH